MVTDLQYYLLIAVAYLGLPTGLLISRFALEEVYAGRRYFRFAKLAAFCLVLLLFFMLIIKSLFTAITVAILTLVTTVIYEKKIDSPLTGLFYYTFFAISIYQARGSSMMPIMTTLVFIFGLLEASNWKARKITYHEMLKLLFQDAIMLLAGFLLQLLF